MQKCGSGKAYKIKKYEGFQGDDKNTVRLLGQQNLMSGKRP